MVKAEANIWGVWCNPTFMSYPMFITHLPSSQQCLCYSWYICSQLRTFFSHKGEPFASFSILHAWEFRIQFSILSMNHILLNNFFRVSLLLMCSRPRLKQTWMWGKLSKIKVSTSEHLGNLSSSSKITKICMCFNHHF